MRSAIGSMAFHASVYWSMNIWCSVWNIGPSTFQWKLCVFRYRTYVSARSRASACEIAARCLAGIPVFNVVGIAVSLECEPHDGLATGERTFLSSDVGH